MLLLALRVRDLWGVPTATGRAVLVLALAAWAGSAYTHIVELRLFALMCGFALLAAIPWLLVPMRVAASLALRPPRAVAGEQVEVSVSAVNHGRLSLWQPLVNLPIGQEETWVRMPTLPPGEARSVEVRADDLRRGVFEVGPARAVRTDPLGLMRRTVRWCEPVELHVRPRMALLSTLGSGQVRDLEGVPSDRMSMSDLAFHALREYVRGDDLRHVHWRSSARAGELLVRQYHDTRRNHATVVLDPSAASWATDDDYELGVSIAASLVMCAAREEYDVSLVSGDERITAVPGGVVLDATCRVQRASGPVDLVDEVRQAIGLAPGTSLLFVVTGSASADLDAIAAALVPVPADTRRVVLRTAPGQAPSMLRQHGHEVLTVPSLAELPGVMTATS